MRCQSRRLFFSVFLVAAATNCYLLFLWLIELQSPSVSFPDGIIIYNQRVQENIPRSEKESSPISLESAELKERVVVASQQQNVENEPPQGKPTRTVPCALLFFGLPKVFDDVVLPSIQKHIIEPNNECDVYAHTYNISITNNERNGEDAAAVFPEQAYHLTPNVIMDTIEEFNAVRNLTHFREYFPHIRPWTYPTTMDNMIKQWHSIERVFSSMSQSRIGYVRVGLFR